MILELLKEKYIVFVKQSEVVNAVFTHTDSFDTYAERESAVYIRVDITAGKNVGMHHARTQHFDPSLTFAETTALAAAYEA